MPLAELTDASIGYDVHGQGDPLVLVPGLGATLALWQPVLNSLQRHFCVVRLDNRGVGQSVARRPARTVRDYSADLLELLDHLQINRAHVMGLSLGGVVAQRFAVDHPDRIQRLVLVSCTNSFTPYLREIAMLVGRTLRWLPRNTFTRTMEVLSAGPLFLDEHPDRVEQRVALVRRQGVHSREVMRQLRALGASRVEPGEFRILAPTLVIGGEFDSLIPNCYARRMAEGIEGSRFVVIPNAGHNPFNDCPEIVLPLIVRFMIDGCVDADLVVQRHADEEGPAVVADGTRHVA